LVPVRFSRTRLGARGHEEVRRIGASSPIPSDQSTQTLSVKLLRKAASFTSEGALIRQGDCFRIARKNEAARRQTLRVRRTEQFMAKG
jgi:hypothetical protein